MISTDLDGRAMTGTVADARRQSGKGAQRSTPAAPANVMLLLMTMWTTAAETHDVHAPIPGRHHWYRGDLCTGSCEFTRPCTCRVSM